MWEETEAKETRGYCKSEVALAALGLSQQAKWDFYSKYQVGKIIFGRRTRVLRNRNKSRQSVAL